MIVLLSRLYELLYASEAIASYEYTVKATTIYRQGAMLAPIRLTNAAAQLVLRTQVRRKETHPHHPSAPLPPLPASSIIAILYPWHQFRRYPRSAASLRPPL